VQCAALGSRHLHKRVHQGRTNGRLVEPPQHTCGQAALPPGTRPIITTATATTPSLGQGDRLNATTHTELTAPPFIATHCCA
jgi:hypothetical protein